MDVVYRVNQDAVGTDSSHWMMDIGLDGQCHYIVRESTKTCIYIKQTIVTQALCIRACVPKSSKAFSDIPLGTSGIMLKIYLLERIRK